MNKDLYPFPTYETILYSHHSEAPEQESREKTFLETEVAEYFRAVGRAGEADATYAQYVEAMTEEVNALVAAAEDALLPACTDEPPVELRATYERLYEETQALCALMGDRPSELVAEAWYLCDALKPRMVAVRDLVEEAMDAAPRHGFGSMLGAVCC